jgi:hypothetical protein
MRTLNFKIAGEKPFDKKSYDKLFENEPASDVGAELLTNLNETLTKKPKSGSDKSSDKK